MLLRTWSETSTEYEILFLTLPVWATPALILSVLRHHYHQVAYTERTYVYDCVCIHTQTRGLFPYNHQGFLLFTLGLSSGVLFYVRQRPLRPWLLLCGSEARRAAPKAGRALRLSSESQHALSPQEASQDTIELYEMIILLQNNSLFLNYSNILITESESVCVSSFLGGLQIDTRVISAHAWFVMENLGLCNSDPLSVCPSKQYMSSYNVFSI